MRRALFIRHAETDMAGRYCGHSDPDLNAQGRGQLVRLVEKLSGEPFDRLYSSDLRRAANTAHALALDREMPVELRPALREIHFGEWEGMSWEQVERGDPEYAKKWVNAYPQLPAPAGESVEAFERRVLKEVDDLLNSGSIAVVTHAGVLRVVLRHLCGYSEKQAWQETRSYCCVVRYQDKGESQ